MDQLLQHLDDWTECLQTYGSDLLAAPGILRTLLLGIIPTELEDELLSKPHVKTWQEIINWCKIKTVYRRQKVLSEAARRPGGRINSLIIDHPDDKEDEPEKNGSAAFDESQPPQWFLDHINALSGKGKGGGKGDRNSRRDTKGGGKGKGVRITFKGCWHCGDERSIAAASALSFRSCWRTSTRARSAPNGSCHRITQGSMSSPRRKLRQLLRKGSTCLTAHQMWIPRAMSGKTLTLTSWDRVWAKHAGPYVSPLLLLQSQIPLTNCVVNVQ